MADIDGQKYWNHVDYDHKLTVKWPLICKFYDQCIEEIHLPERMPRGDQERLWNKLN